MSKKNIFCFIFLIISSCYSQKNDLTANVEMDFFGNLFIDATMNNMDISNDTLVIDSKILIHNKYATLLGGEMIGKVYFTKYLPKSNQLSYVINLPKNDIYTYVKKGDYFFTTLNYLPISKKKFYSEKKFDINFKFPNKYRIIYPDSSDIKNVYQYSPPIIAGDFINSEINGFKVYNLKKDNKKQGKINKMVGVVKDAYDFYQINYPKKNLPKIIFLPLEGSLGGLTLKDVILLDSNILNDSISTEKRLIAHEVAHLWWGVGGIRFDNNFYNEGVAEYMALKYLEHIGDREYVKKSKNTKYYHIEGITSHEEIYNKKLTTEEKGIFNYDYTPLLFFNIETDKNDLFKCLSEFYRKNEGSKESISVGDLDLFLKQKGLEPIIKKGLLPDFFFMEEEDKFILKGLNVTNERIELELTDNNNIKTLKTFLFSQKKDKCIINKNDYKKIVIDPEYKVLQFSRLNDVWINNDKSVFSKNRYFPIDEVKPEVLYLSTKILDYLFSNNNVRIYDLTCEENLWLIEKIDKLKEGINKNDELILTGASTLFKIGDRNHNRLDIKATFYSKKDNTSKFIYFYLYYDKSLKFLQNFKLESELNTLEE